MSLFVVNFRFNIFAISILSEQVAFHENVFSSFSTKNVFLSRDKMVRRINVTKTARYYHLSDALLAYIFQISLHYVLNKT